MWWWQLIFIWKGKSAILSFRRIYPASWPSSFPKSRSGSTGSRFRRVPSSVSLPSPPLYPEIYLTDSQSRDGVDPTPSVIWHARCQSVSERKKWHHAVCNVLFFWEKKEIVFVSFILFLNRENTVLNFFFFFLNRSDYFGVAYSGAYPPHTANKYYVSKGNI